MTDWKTEELKAEKFCKIIAPIARDLRIELKVCETILAFWADKKLKAQRQTTPVTILPISATSKRPERIATNIVNKAKALSYNDRKELIKALEGELTT